jgi:hypothetical protein
MQLIDFLKSAVVAGLWTMLALLVWGLVLTLAATIFHVLRVASREVKKIPWGIRR